MSYTSASSIDIRNRRPPSSYVESRSVSPFSMSPGEDDSETNLMMMIIEGRTTPPPPPPLLPLSLSPSPLIPYIQAEPHSAQIVYSRCCSDSDNKTAREVVFEEIKRIAVAVGHRDEDVEEGGALFRLCANMEDDDLDTLYGMVRFGYMDDDYNEVYSFLSSEMQKHEGCHT